MSESLLAGLCDDAAVFPPGNMPLDQAVPVHLQHRQGPHAGLVGPLVIAAKDLPALAEVAADVPEGMLDVTVTVTVTVTVPLSAVSDAVADARAIPAVRLVGLEIALPDETPVEEVVPALDDALADNTTLMVFMEVPRDGRREPLLAALAGSPYLGKFRTGGVRADLYPDEGELAAAVLAAVRAGVPFKATAGLHHALRNTDPATGFEQHGFLNLLVATGAALEGADHAELVALLGERDGSRVAERARSLAPTVRETFRSFGTCSIAEPVEELAGLGLLPAHSSKGLL
ncbi:hypothetical protein [Micromonospora globispora]|uniref:hypothetical protein n=1 Tax=Micromonospora globispora TaxID=1450148 RepID=UPI001A9C872A|nr:hypothetical protein [Micromonospora globispora]